MHISLAAETIAHFGPFPISNSFLMAVIVSIFWITIALLPKPVKGRFYACMETIIEGLLSAIESIVGQGKVARQILPLIATFFLMVITSNWFGIFPGIGSIGFFETHAQVQEKKEEPTQLQQLQEVQVPESQIESTAPSVAEHPESAAPSEVREPEHEVEFVPMFRPVNTDLNMTLAIALISVFMTQIISIKNIKIKPYLKKFFNFTNPVLCFVGLLEIISELVKVLSFSFRLFGNLFAGEVLLVVIFSLVPFVAPIPFLGIELFAGFIQALIFSMLTLVFINGAVQTHEAH